MKENENWRFSDLQNTAVFTTRQIINDNMPILYVSHDEDDGAWQFQHGGNVDMEYAMLVSLAKIVDLDNTINELFDLPLGWIAIRSNRIELWERKRR
jgi:hypothetical protein